MRARRIPLFSACSALFLLFVLALFLCKAELAMDGVRRGLSLCTETLFPSLFPFLVLSELLVGVGAGRLLGVILAKPLSPVLGLSRAGCSAYLLGILCGIPVGTVTAVSLFERGEIGKEELQRLQLFCNQASSGFLVGAVGRGMLGSARIGAVLYGIVILSSFLFAVLLRVICGRVPEYEPLPSTEKKSTVTLSLFTQSVRRAFSSMLQICAFLLFFSCITACLADVGQALSLPSFVLVILSGFLEMTSGISAAVLSLSPTAAFCAVAFFAAFSGLSVCLQLFSLTEGLALRVLPYLGARAIQGIIALLLASLYLLLKKGLPPAQSEVAAFSLQEPQLALQLGLLALFLLFALKKGKRRALSPTRKTKKVRM